MYNLSVKMSIIHTIIVMRSGDSIFRGKRQSESDPFRPIALGLASLPLLKIKRKDQLSHFLSQFPSFPFSLLNSSIRFVFSINSSSSSSSSGFR
ncbi:unnamed protein product [Citrullus colocynthis]|uniref:Ycf15 n=1 Tax=Citrullus colocynthis TaxID=252529 RepID=A0ABP0Z762_9ROSI